ncbi:unnamed protein product [Rotaria sp. Silwood1]|nr:unnamed protein product [Rotaria sp. Silwood1]CAF5103074.1 unnamed protein product [Rotaria sp. Silwood1]
MISQHIQLLQLFRKVIPPLRSHAHKAIKKRPSASITIGIGLSCLRKITINCSTLDKICSFRPNPGPITNVCNRGNHLLISFEKFFEF